MNNSVKILISGDTEKAAFALRDFLNTSVQSFDFPELNQQNYRADLWKALFNIVASQRVDLHSDCLAAIRLLSRDKTNLNELLGNDRLNLLLYHTGLKGEKNLQEGNNYGVAVEGLKCLCNIIFNATVPRALCCKNGIIESIVNRIRTYRETKLALEIRYFDMKILFLITALCSEIRPKLKNELHGLTYLIESLDLLLKELHENNSDMQDDQTDSRLSDSQVNYSCELLKTIFNITIQPSFHNTIDEEEEAHYLRLVNILHDFLLVETQSASKKLELDSNIVNLLTNMPDHCLKQLITNIQNEQLELLPKRVQFEQQNMSAVYEILQFLRSRFGDEPGVSNQHEILSPVLTVLLKCATSCRAIRKYLRLQILPPLRDVHNRPEQGTTLRNCLCRLLTTPITQVRDLASELLFILCKENVRRMIKYTGYGNAAGMFANRGLLGGRNEDVSIYSSDSEDSETEEYSEYKHGINPIMGCYQAPRPNPTAHMTEEQKEYEAMKLVELMSNLSKHGIVKPCKIGKDGRPEPIEHVLQLQTDLPNQQVHMDDESD